MQFPDTYSKEDNINVIIETPYKSRNKYAYDPESGFFKLKKVIPSGLEFPCDMGFISNTKGSDGDPLDVLILMDEITYPGCLIECRLLGVIKGTQHEKGKKIRNDRFIAVPAVMIEYDHLNNLKDLNENKLESLIRFLENYNANENKHFKIKEISDAKEAHKLLKKNKS
jgi:inorganic pyrophosphatase